MTSALIRKYRFNLKVSKYLRDFVQPMSQTRTHGVSLIVPGGQRSHWCLGEFPKLKAEDFHNFRCFMIFFLDGQQGPCIVKSMHRYEDVRCRFFYLEIYNAIRTYLGVSKNNGTPKSSILIGFSIINHPFRGTPIFGNIHFNAYTLSFTKQRSSCEFGLCTRDSWQAKSARLQIFPTPLAMNFFTEGACVVLEKALPVEKGTSAGNFGSNSWYRTRAALRKQSN